MIDNTTLKEYVSLCQLFGACIHRVQGPGGNISVKENNKLIIKSSGVSLFDTTEKSGYVICNLLTLQKKLDTQDEDVISCVEGGDLNKPPSMECFFHLLPFRVIVHIHPTSIVSVLCNKEKINNLKVRFPGALYIPYQKPGLQLANDIFKSFQGQSIIFLENHGVVLCSNKKDPFSDLSAMYDTLEKEIQSPYSSVKKELEYKSYLSEEYLLKPIYSVTPDKIPKSFPALTPDQVLFLKKEPFYMKDTPETIDVQKYSILIDNTFIYSVGKNALQCKWIEEILLSYIPIYEFNHLTYTTLQDFQREALFHSKQEQYRLSLK